MAEVLDSTLWPFTRSPMVARFIADPLVTPGVNAVFTVTFTAVPALGDTIQFDFGGNSILMTCNNVLGPDGSAWIRGVTTGANATALATGCLANYYLGTHFDISAAGDVVTFTAKEIGADFNLTTIFTPGTFATSNLDTPGVDEYIVPGHAVGINVSVETGPETDQYIQLPDQVGYVDENNKVHFDLGPLIRPYMKKAITRPAFAQASVHYGSYFALRYILRHWLIYGDPPEPRSVTTRPETIAFYIGLRNEDYPHTNSLWLSLYGFTRSNFLTYRNRTYRRKVTREEQHYLGWYQFYGDLGEAIVLKTTVYYTDGSDLDADALTHAASGLKDRITHWPAGWDILNLDAVDATGLLTPYKYELWLFGNATAEQLTEKITFYLDDSDYNDLYFEFINSLGAVETLRTKGGWEEGIELSMQQVQQQFYQTDDITPDQSAYTSEPLEHQRSLQVNHVCDHVDEMRALLDIFNHDGVQLVDMDRSIKLPVQLGIASHVVRTRGTEGEHVYTLNLEFLLNDPDRLHSNLPLP